jgi:two-component system nitrogen regulation sensor histidine kinase NtrY
LLLGAVGICSFYALKPSTDQEIADRISDNVNHQVQLAQKDFELIALNLKAPSEISSRTHFPFFIFSKDSVLFWSANNFVPSASMAKEKEVQMVKSGGGVYLLVRKSIDRDISVVSAILLQREYLITNDYLNQEYNSDIFSSTDVRIVEPESLSGVAINLGNETLFKVLALPRYNAHDPVIVWIGILLTCTLVVIVLFLFWNVTSHIATKSVVGSIAFLIAVCWISREAMIYVGLPGIFTRSELFNPRVFAVSNLNPSLGDLVFNMVFILFICIYIFKNYSKARAFVFTNDSLQFIIEIASCLCIFYAGLFPFVLIQTIYNNSAISLDITANLDFSTVKVIFYVAVLISGICTFLFSHAFIRILVRDRNALRLYLAVSIAVALFIVFNSITGQPYVVSMLLTLFYFAVVYFLRLFKSLKRFTYSTFSYLFVGIFFLSLNGAYAIQYFSHREKIAEQFRFANSFLVDRDVFGEYLLHEAYLKIANDAFTQTRIITPFLRREAIDQKIRQYFLPSYFNKYDVEIFIYDGVGQPIGDEQMPSFADLISRYDKQAVTTDYEGIRFVNNPQSDFSHKYVVVVPVRRIESISGYVVLELSLKKIIPESVYPELLVDYSRQQIILERSISYAVISNGKVQFSSGDFNYEKYFARGGLGNPKLYSEGILVAGYYHTAIENDNNKVAIVSTRSLPAVYQATNFSFLFVLGLFVILALFVVQGIFNYTHGGRLFFSARIQLYLNLAFFVPLIIVSISTLGLTTRSSQQQLDEEYLNKSRSLAQQLTSEIQPNLFLRGESTASFNNRLAELAGVSKLEANVYKPDGTLAGTTQPLIFENHLLAPFVNSSALSRIRNGENYFIEGEQVGKLSYFVAYTSLQSSTTGNVLGILAVPFFQSAHSLEKIQIVLLANILNIFALIFILLLILSYFVSRWLTFPLTFITQSLRRTSLTKTNQPLTWNSPDEIGLMVKEYNSMLYKLSESKNQLELTQREKAWREIAQQVAHEIKNPLTPMKLTLQQLERSVQSGNGTSEKIQKAIESLLSQVNTLNDIASSFSGFAKMPELKIVELNLIDIVKRAVDLHSSAGQVTLKLTVTDAFVKGDEQLLERTISNLIINGFQSAQPGRAVAVVVSLEAVGNKFFVCVKDNGVGIAPEIQELVFLPHFSTKKSGSGLGLAIAKQGIEQMNGKIWFETQEGKGTSFFIELPRIENRLD